MAGKPSSDWDKVQLEEWAFSVAALGWSRDEYWMCSRSEFVEIRKMWMTLNGHDTKEKTVADNADAMNNYLSSFGGTTSNGSKHQ